MMEFIKKQGIAFYVSIAAVIFAIVSVIIFSSNAADAYFSDVHTGKGILTMTIIAIILDVAVLVAGQFFADNKIVKVVLDVAMIAVTVLLVCSVMLFIKDRVYYMAIVYGSELESDNPAAWGAVNQSIVGMVMYFITIACTVAAAFFQMRKPEKA